MGDRRGESVQLNTDQSGFRIDVSDLLLLMLLTTFGLFSIVAASDNSNPADELAEIINNNRTASKLPTLLDNPGLACIALQYIHAFESDCDAVGEKKPPASLFNSTFAQSCGVQPSSVSSISGILLGCQSNYVSPNDAFNTVLLAKEESASIIANKNYKEFGVGISGYAGGAPYYWCVMFSDNSPNTTFVLKDENATSQSTGCFSGTHDHCSNSYTASASVGFGMLVITILSIFLANF